ncbi:MAG: hypothetical protein ED859_04710 [Desulfuromonadales bacterium]|nr:MAG: hypothetical protein ED859_04710 [Desulfuromonadales bacterium]
MPLWYVLFGGLTAMYASVTFCLAVDKIHDRKNRYIDTGHVQKEEPFHGELPPLPPVHLMML